MDDRHFDDLTKFVGRTASRRAVVKGVAAAALAAVFGRAARGEDSAEAAIYQQGGVKQRVRVYCNQAGQTCRDSKNPTRRCCYRCNGSLTNPSSKCCEDEGFACINDSHCCDGRICRDPDLFDGVNLKGCFDRGDLDPGAECLDSSECNTGICLSGVCCTAEQACYDPYTGTGSCCQESETCNEATGECSSCPPGWIVLADGDCAIDCLTQSCAGGTCQCGDTFEGFLCVDIGDILVGACLSGPSCPVGYVCQAFSCYRLCGPANPCAAGELAC